jgi:hypothetical protein
MIYVIGPEKFSKKGLKTVKIGYSTDPNKRLAALQTSNEKKLVLLATCPGDRNLEKLFHYEFRKWKIRGEWFALYRHSYDHLIRLVYGRAQFNQGPLPPRNLNQSPGHLINRQLRMHQGLVSMQTDRPTATRVKTRIDTSIVKTDDDPTQPPIIELGRGPLGHRQWGFTCADCGLTFHRTSEVHAIAWREQHPAHCVARPAPQEDQPAHMVL